MKLLGILSLLIVSLLSISAAESPRPSSDEEALAVTAKGFFTTWLLHRNAEEAIKYVSARPILGSCMTPEHLNKKKSLAREDVLNIFRKVFATTLGRTSKAQNLSVLVDSSGGISSEDGNVIFARHPMEQYFQIFRLKPVKDPSDIAYICKFR